MLTLRIKMMIFWRRPLCRTYQTHITNFLAREKKYTSTTLPMKTSFYRSKPFGQVRPIMGDMYLRLMNSLACYKMIISNMLSPKFARWKKTTNLIWLNAPNLLSSPTEMKVMIKTFPIQIVQYIKELRGSKLAQILLSLAMINVTGLRKLWVNNSWKLSWTLLMMNIT